MTMYSSQPSESFAGTPSVPDFFVQQNDQSEILIDAFETNLTIDGAQCNAPISILLQKSPVLQLVLQTTCLNSHQNIAYSTDSRITIEINGGNIECLIASLQLQPGLENWKLHAKELPIQMLGNSSTKIHKLVFPLVNCDSLQDSCIETDVEIPPSFDFESAKPLIELYKICFSNEGDLTNSLNDSGDSNSETASSSELHKGKRCHQSLGLNVADWIVKLSRLPNSSPKSNGNSNHYKVTHVGEIFRVDNTPFSSQDGEDIIAGLDCFLSFLLGKRFRIGLIKGIDDQKNPVWLQYAEPKNSLENNLSWWNRTMTPQAQELFPLFMAKYMDADWREVLRHAVYWYVIANSSETGTDGGSALGPVIIEKIADKMISDKAIPSRKTDDTMGNRFYDIACHMKIPTHIPPSYQAMIDYQNVLSNRDSSKKWDAPQVIMKVRNSLIHAKTDITDNHRKNRYCFYIRNAPNPRTDTQPLVKS